MATQVSEVGALKARLQALEDVVALHEKRFVTLIDLLGAQDISEGAADAYGALVSLTPRQHAVLQMLMRGASNKEIALRLEVTEATAKTHVRAIAGRLNVKTRSQIIAKMMATLERMSPADYRRISGGLPKDWDENWTVDDEDPYKSVYS